MTKTSHLLIGVGVTLPDIGDTQAGDERADDDRRNDALMLLYVKFQRSNALRLEQAANLTHSQVKRVTMCRPSIFEILLSAETLLINVAGQDKPGLMAALTVILTEYDARMLDIGQAVIHSDLALGILVRLDAAVAKDCQSRLFEAAQAAGSDLRISTISPDQYTAWLEASGQPRFILTLLTAGDATSALNAVSSATHQSKLNIDTMRRLTDRGDADVGDREDRFCVEMRLRGSAGAVDTLRDRLMERALELDFDFSLQQDTVFRRNRRLVAFDMDSTLIRQEVMDELAHRHGVGPAVAQITTEAMAGGLDFKESFRRRAAMLKGMPITMLDDVAGDVELNNGARRLLQALKYFGYKTAVISGGFQYVGDVLQRQLGIDYVFANKLQHVDGVMTGEVDGDIVDAQRKAELLRVIAQTEDIALEQTIAIGDGANDLPMLAQSGLGVAFHAKPLVRETARHAISTFGLDAVLYLIGFSDRDIDQALSASDDPELR
ncbi:MAG: phosphoserine phosphatase SerB [Pseudomonadota bacterium]